ncbi:hypothetical protein JCM11641_007512 [Rhodosporidiobolus odoratus]
MLDYYKNFINKVQSAPTWSPAQEQVLVEPYAYLAAIPGKDVRSAVIAAFNIWMGCDERNLETVKKVVGMLHTASLLMDDVEDESELRRGMPVAHKIYGIPQTLNTANYACFLALHELPRLQARPGLKVGYIVNEELLNLHRGQGMDIFWRENLICPTESEYVDMVNNKTGGLFRVAVKLMMATSTEEDPQDYVPLANLIGIIFQIRDDYVNLQSDEYAQNKGFCEDLSEGKFSFPIVHSIRADPSNRQIINILRSRPSDPATKIHAVNYMKSTTHSFAYTRQVLSTLTAQAYAEVARLGGNRGIEAILKKLEVEEPEDEVAMADGEFGEDGPIKVAGKLWVNGNGHGHAERMKAEPPTTTTNDDSASV